MDTLDPIEKKALELAARSDDADSALKAVQILNAVADQRQKLADFAQTAVESKKAAHAFAKVQLLAKILTPILPVIAILLTAGTLVFQIVQFSKTSEAQRDSAEDTQWHESMKSVATQPASAALVAAFNMQSFLDSPRYGEQARSILSTLLPDIEDSSGFDVVFFNLRRTTDEKRQDELVGIARIVAAKDLDIFNAENHGPTKTFQGFVRDPTTFYQNEQDSPKLRLALARSWEIDSISQGLSYLWLPNTATFKGSPSGRNLAGIILESNFAGVNFSSANLNSASFWGATINGADFSGISTFDKSEWQDTRWWNAGKMSCGLAQYLLGVYPPKKTEDVTAARSLTSRSCP